MRPALHVRHLLSIFVSCASFLAAMGTRKPTGLILTQSNDHSNISELLDNLLRGYDNSVRPDFGGPPATVEVDIMVRSMGPISEVDMTYSMDCYFRQSWVDRRLAFRGGKETLALSISMLARIWKPDTYFYNGKQSYLHTITSPNKFVRLYQDGRVLYSSRLTIKAGCPMNLEDFPMDTQRCPLQFGSFGYTTHDVVYKWNSARQVAIAEDMKLSQFDLVANPTANESNESLLAHTEYSVLLVYFHLQRHMGNFLIQVYGPCVLLVVLSWVSFWLNREATADRVSLGITTVLTMTFLGLEARTDLPKVSYPTALDFFVFLSFAFIFATIIQFAVVHYFTKYGSGEVYFNSDLSDSEISSGEEEEPMVITTFPACSNGRSESAEFQAWQGTTSSSSRKESEEYGRVSSPVGRKNETPVLPLRMVPRENSPTVRGYAREAYEWQQVAGRKSLTDRRPDAPIKAPTRLSISSTKKPRKRRKAPRYNSVSKIDRASRVVFPLFFLAINLFYWYAYLSRSKRMSYYNSNSNGA